MVHRGYPGSTNENVVVGKGHLSGSSQFQFDPQDRKAFDGGFGERSIPTDEPKRFRPVVAEPVDEAPAHLGRKPHSPCLVFGPHEGRLKVGVESQRDLSGS